MAEIEVMEQAADKLWVLTKVKESVCAFNSANVEAILLLEQEVTPLPNSDGIYVGIAQYRGGFLPILDLRHKMGMKSQLEELQEFEQMLNQRKQDHIHWVEELRRCVEEDVPFKLATDPHKCAFGKWYDHYEPTSLTVAHHLRKIDEPHKKLHATAEEAFRCERNCAACERDECRRDALRRGTEEYMPQVVKLLDEAKVLFRDGHRNMVIVISNQSKSCGILVDEVLSVEMLDMVEDGDRLNEQHDALVSKIARRLDAEELVLVLNQSQILGEELVGA